MPRPRRFCRPTPTRARAIGAYRRDHAQPAPGWPVELAVHLRAGTRAAARATALRRADPGNRRSRLRADGRRPRLADARLGQSGGRLRGLDRPHLQEGPAILDGDERTDLTIGGVERLERCEHVEWVAVQ